MKIGYKKKHLNVNLILGLVWLILFFIRVSRKETPIWTEYVWIVMSLIYLGIYFYQKKHQYLTIKKGIITVNGPFGEKLNLTELKRIKKFAGDYILKTDHQELIIDKQLIDPKSLAKLNAELERLHVEWH